MTIKENIASSNGDGVIPVPPVYEMTIDLNVLDHLGINLYSNVAAVLTEVVANAWDAEAKEVRISYDYEGQKITITDNGLGMTITDMNHKFLKVGYRRRLDDPSSVTPNLKRPVMGRKGLGKLSLFSIADTVQVESSKNDERHGLVMRVPEIRAVIDGKKGSYHPSELDADKLTVVKGTKILLSDLKKSRVPATFTALKRKLARRFSVVGSADFKVYIDDSEVTLADRDDLKVVEFLWEFGASCPDRLAASPNRKESAILDARLQAWQPGWIVKGWIGTSSKPKDLDTGDGNLNSIVVLSRGRLFHENVLDTFNDGRLYTKYLTGQLEFDCLDAPDQADIATSDRQRVIEDDERYIQLLAFLRSSLTKVERQWGDWRRKHAVDEVIQEHPVVKEWMDGLDSDADSPVSIQARALIAKVHSLPIDNPDDKKELLRNAVIAFERLRLRGNASQLIEAVDVGAEKLLPLVAQRDLLEASLYRDIVKSRIDVIKVFQKLVDENAKEKALQSTLFNHLWILDSSWEKSAGSEQIETRLKESGVIVDDLTEKEKLGRVDIAYRSVLGKHVIVELKRAGRKMTLAELTAQGQLYFDKLSKILLATGHKNFDIEVVFVIGPLVDEEQSNPDRVKKMMDSISPGSRIRHFDELIHASLSAYQEYIDKGKEIDKIDAIVNKL